MKRILLSITLSMVAAISSRADLTNGLIAYFPFNGNANDESGNGNDAVIHGAGLITDRFGKAARAYGFNGIDNYIVATVTTLPAGNSPRTITGWIKTAQTNFTLSVIGYGAGNGNSQFGLGAGNDPDHSYLYFWKGLTAWQPGLKVPSDEWSFLAVTYSNQNLTVWVNDAKTNWTGCDQYGCLNTTNNQRLFMGAVAVNGAAPGAPAGFQTWYAGGIDNVRVYNRALSVQEVMDIYALERPDVLSIETAAVRLSWLAKSNVTYQIQSTVDFQTWSNEAPILGNGSNTNVVEWTDGGRRFYRLNTVP